MTSRIYQAIEETNRQLEKSLSYSAEFRKPAQISYYTAHLAFLRSRLSGDEVEPAVADMENWDKVQCVIDRRN